MVHLLIFEFSFLFYNSLALSPDTSAVKTLPLMPDSSSVSRSDSSRILPVVDSILAYSKKLLGTPYRFKGRKHNKRGSMNCSQFVVHVFGKFGYNLPSTSLLQAAVGEEVSLPEVRKGDLLFFTGRSRKSRRIGHVAIVLDTAGGEITMIHASRRGVVIDNYTNSLYYRNRFKKACRIDFNPAEEDTTANQ